MSDPFVAEIRMFGGNFAPTGWAQCNGQLLPLSQNTALFSLLGTYYGGDGKSTFALPNLQGSSPIGQGQGAGLSERSLGEAAARRTSRLLAVGDPGAQPQPQRLRRRPGRYQHSQVRASFSGPRPGSTCTVRPSNTTLNAQELSVFGSSQPHNNQQPYLVVNFIIAMQGVFPPRG